MNRIFILSLLLFTAFGKAQQPLSPEVTLAKQPLLILPAKGGDDPESIDSKVTAIVASKATELKRFEVIDRNHLEQLLEEQAIQMSGIIDDQSIVQFGKVASAPEALIVRVLNFGQEGVPPEDEEEEDRKDRKVARKAGLFGIIAKQVVDAAVDKATKDVERYPNNIQTIIQAEVRKVDVETGKSLASFTINASHTGGNKKASLAKTLLQVGWQVSNQLREMYLLTSEVLDVRGNEVMLLLGKEMGVQKGTVFEIASPETKKLLRDREITIPGRTVGIVRVTELSRDANRGRILRKWDRIEPGYRAVESTRHIASIDLQGLYSNNVPAYTLQAQLDIAPLDKISGAAHFNLGTVRDSREDTDFRFGFGFGLQYKLIHTSPFALAATITLPINLIFRSDDQSHSVALPVFSPEIGARTTIMLGPTRDLVLAVSYVFANATGSWKYSKENDEGDTDTFAAVWTNRPAPKVDLRGFYFSVGMRFLSF
ncbi:MAG: hypothetical protein GXO92_03285 [FCB group bacterium]|nr:hypothetical protein [FCB group bacterium]